MGSTRVWISVLARRQETAKYLGLRIITPLIIAWPPYIIGSCGTWLFPPNAATRGGLPPKIQTDCVRL